ncbi:MAG: Ig-like domain-containing protein, partial [Dehalococcoidia bacterium]|nr:Ig-like domain-containing protein [Dehalococcoidia bacterium]
VFPGQPMTYTITFENEGSGDAFGVFVVDKLGEHLDTSTLTIYGGGEFSSASRTLTWSVGQLAPKGQPGSTGVVSFTVRLKPDLATGTVVVNQAVVHFPSVPEETPTNAVTNIVQPIAAIPQAVETVAGQAVAIRLQGRSASGASLTYTIVEQPLNGELSGTQSNLTYMPSANFTGLDRLRFTVSDGITTRRPDEVQILVRPSANDTTPPRILWTAPENGAVIAQIVTTPRFTDTIGPLYLPPVQIEFSETMSATTITTDTIRMTDGSGRALALRVTYDGLVNQAMILSREPLIQGMQYTVTVTSGAKDLMGNSLAADYVWSFRIGGSTIYLPFISK